MTIRRRFLRADRSFQGLVQLRARPARSAKLIVNYEARRQTESRRRLGRQSPITRAKLAADERLRSFHDAHGAGEDRIKRTILAASEKMIPAWSRD